MNKIIALLVLLFTLKGFAANPTLAGTNNFTGKNTLTNADNIFAGTFQGAVPQNGYGTNLTFIGSVTVGDGTASGVGQTFQHMDSGDGTVDTATFTSDGNGFTIATAATTGNDNKTLNLAPANGRVAIGAAANGAPNTLDMGGDIALSGNLNAADGDSSYFDSSSHGNLNSFSGGTAFVGSQGNFNLDSQNCTFLNSQGNANYDAGGTRMDNSFANSCWYGQNYFTNSSANQSFNSAGSIFYGAHGCQAFSAGSSTFRNGAQADVNYYSANCVFDGDEADANWQSDSVTFTNASEGNVNYVNPGAIFNNCVAVDISGNGSTFNFTNELSLKASAGYYFLGDSYAIRQTTAYTPTNPVASSNLTGTISIARLPMTIYSGSTNIGSTVTALTIQIGHTMANTNYVPAVSFMGSALAAAVVPTYSARTTTSFVLNLTGTGFASTEALGWTVIYSP